MSVTLQECNNYVILSQVYSVCGVQSTCRIHIHGAGRRIDGVKSAMYAERQRLSVNIPTESFPQINTLASYKALSACHTCMHYLLFFLILVCFPPLLSLLVRIDSSILCNSLSALFATVWSTNQAT